MKNFPAGTEDPDNWVLGSLRHVKFDNLMASPAARSERQPGLHAEGLRADPEAQAQRRRSAFATAINGAESLQAIAKRIGVPLNDALLIVFRFASLEIIDYWSSNVLSLPAAAPGPVAASTAA